MLLDRIDIDAHGPLDCVELGPFSEQLNVIYGASGSGKTAIVRFVRDSLIDRAYPQGMMSSSSGRVVWADRHGMVHCRREKDGTRHGRRSIEIENRSTTSYSDAFPGSSWVDKYNGSHPNHLAAQSIELPESIVDGVMTDTSITDVRRIVAACQRSGLDNADTFRELPLGDPLLQRWHDEHLSCCHTDHLDASGPDASYLDADPISSTNAAQNRRELADVEAELDRIQAQWRRWDDAHATFHRDDQLAWMDQQYHRLVRRRNSLTAQLANHRFVSSPAYHPWINGREDRHEKAHHDLAHLHLRCDQLRARRHEISRWIKAVQQRITSYQSMLSDEAQRTRSSWDTFRSDENLRRQIDELDRQMIHWRRALLEVQGLQTAIGQWPDSTVPLSASGIAPQLGIDPFSIDYADAGRHRYEHFLRSIDRYRDLHSWNESYSQVTGDSAYQRLLEIESRLGAASRVIDRLASHYASLDRPFYRWYDNARDDSLGNGYGLPETLQSIRDELNDLIHGIPGSRLGTIGDNDRRSWNPDIAGGYPLSPPHQTSWTHWSPGATSLERTGSLDNERWRKLRQREQWLAQSIEAIGRHREELLRRHAETHNIQVANWTYQTREDLGVLHRELESCRNQYEQVTRELDTTLRRAADVRLSMRSLPIVDNAIYHNRPVENSLNFDTAAIESELREIDTRLANLSRWQWLRSRRQHLRNRLRSLRRPVSPQSPLANVASRWLSQLTGGRLTHMTWSTTSHLGTAESLITIDGHSEATCSAFDRSIAAIAVRLAAGELLHRLGRPVPVVIEASQAFASQRTGDCGCDTATDDRNHTPYSIVSTLRDYAVDGRQVVMLTDDSCLADNMSRAGARTYGLRGQRTYHAHQPQWNTDYRDEHYVGPHPHICRDHDVVDHRPLARPTSHTRSIGDINRDLDIASEEVGDFYRDGYYYADTYTTRGTQNQASANGPSNQHCSCCEEKAFKSPASFSVDHNRGSSTAQTRCPDAVAHRAVTPAGIAAATKSDSPFFLTVDSPIDQAPSIDAVAASRLRSLHVTHITHLMQQDANRLADALGMADVEASTIRGWQSECRLVCRVPHLRGFDARVLVNCGITKPSELAKIHPVELLQRVETFLATDRGQQLLLSGSSHELSRLTSWIAAGNAHHNDYKFDRDRYEYDPDSDLQGFVRSSHSSSRSNRNRSSRDRSSRVSAERTSADSSRRSRRSSDRSSRRRSTDGDSTRHRYGIRRVDADSDREYTQSERTSESRRSSRSSSDRDNRRRQRRSPDAYSREPYSHDTSSRSSTERTSHSSRRSSDRSSRDYQYDRNSDASGFRSSQQSRETNRSSESSGERELRFYLHRESPVVDAPSIGPSMAERLAAIGIHSVDDLLTSDAATVAAQLDHRRVETETVIEWQQQATLVCRVPMLRGHDAQLLVAAEVTTAEELAQQDPAILWSQVEPVALSSEGKRIIRGGKLPDLEEINQWIEYAQHHRALKAA